MVTLGFFDLAGASDLPYHSDAKATESSTATQASLLSHASGFVGGAGVRQINLHNRALCDNCHRTELRCDALYKTPEIQAACDQLAASVSTGLSSGQVLQAWLASSPDAGAQGARCASACLPNGPTSNFYADGYERPYSGDEATRPQHTKTEKARNG